MSKVKQGLQITIFTYLLFAPMPALKIFRNFQNSATSREQRSITYVFKGDTS